MLFRINSLLVALTAIALLAGTAGVAQADLIAHWAFDEAAGASTAVDSTGDHNGAIDTTSAIKPTTGQTGKLGNAYSFTGSTAPAGDGGVTVPHNDNLDTFTNVTLCGWAYLTGNTSTVNKPIIFKNYPASGNPGTSYSLL